MNFKDALKKVLPKELLTQVEEAVGEEFDWGNDLIPRSRLNAVIDQRNESRKALETLTGKESPDDDDLKVILGKIKTSGTEDHAKEIEDLKKAHEAEIADLKVRYAASDKLREFGALDPNLVWESSLIDKSKIKFDDKGVLTGLEDQLTTLKKDKAYLFGEAEPGDGTGRNSGGGDSFANIKTKEEFLKLPTADQIKFKTQNPTAFSAFLKG